MLIEMIVCNLPKLIRSLSKQKHSQLVQDVCLRLRRTTQAGREAQSEHCSNVSLYWAAQYSLLETQNRLIYEARHQPVLDVRVR